MKTMPTDRWDSPGGPSLEALRFQAPRAISPMLGAISISDVAPSLRMGLAALVRREWTSLEMYKLKGLSTPETAVLPFCKRCLTRTTKICRKPIGYW